MKMIESHATTIASLSFIQAHLSKLIAFNILFNNTNAHGQRYLIDERNETEKKVAHFPCPYFRTEYKNMNPLSIEFVDQLPDDIEEKMRRDLVKYETSQGVDVNYKRFSLILRDEKEGAIAVLHAYTAFAEIHVDDLWVDTAHRGQGYGKKLLQALEEHFKGQGFNNINLITSAAHAPEFYKKCGFTVEFVRENKKNPLLSKTCFIKYFNEAIKTQGLL